MFADVVFSARKRARSRCERSRSNPPRASTTTAETPSSGVGAPIRPCGIGHVDVIRIFRAVVMIADFEGSRWGVAVAYGAEVGNRGPQKTGHVTDALEPILSTIESPCGARSIESTLAIATHILPHLGEVSVDALDREQIRSLIRQVRVPGLRRQAPSLRCRISCDWTHPISSVGYHLIS